MKMCLHFLVLLLDSVYSWCASSSSRNIYLLTLLPYPQEDPAFQPSWTDGDNIRPALELAKDQINCNSSLLQNYTLQLIHADGGCQVTTTTAVSFIRDALQDREEKVTGIVGPGCSDSTIFLSSLTNKTELSLVHAHGAGSPTLSDRMLYQHVVGTLGRTDNYINGILYLKHKANWKKLAVLYDDSRIFYTKAARSLQVNITSNFVWRTSATFVPLRDIQDQRLRVIVVFCPLQLSRQIMCLAYKSGMIYESYQWVILHQLFEELIEPLEFSYDGVDYNCSSENMLIALDKALMITHKFTPSSNNSNMVSNTSYINYLTYYQQYREAYNMQAPRFSAQRNSTYTFWATYLYDAVWAWALVLDNLTKSSDSFEIGSEYGNKNQAERIVEQFYQTKFNGMSGEIIFDQKTGFVDRAANIFQVTDNSSAELVAIVKADNILTKMDFVKISDTFPVSLKERWPVGVFFAIVLLIELIIVIVFHALTVIYRKKPNIKASSPKLLHISYVGTYIAAIGIFVWTLNTADEWNSKIRPFLCQILWVWCLPVGFILAFVPVAMRTWRVYRIFKHYLNPGPFISDPVLIGGTFLALLGVLVISLTWTILDPFYLDDRIHISRDEIGIVVHRKQECSCTYYFYWLAALMGYIMSILAVVSIFSLLTRHIPNKSFTTNNLRVLCYIMALLFALGLPLYSFLSLIVFDPIYHFSALSVVVNLMIAAFIFCIFLPPLLSVFKSQSSTTKKLVRKTTQISRLSFHIG